MAKKNDRQYMLHRWICFDEQGNRYGALSIESATKAAESGMRVYDAREGKWIEPNGDYRNDPMPDVAELLNE